MSQYAVLLRRWLCVAAIAAALIGCNKQQRGFYDAIPADSRVIIRADLSEVLKSAGCDSENGKIALTPNVENLCRSIDSVNTVLLSSIASMGDVIDLSSATTYTANGHAQLVVTASMLPEIQFGGEPKELESTFLGTLRTFDLPDGITVLANDRQAWVSHCESFRLLAILDSALRLPHDETLAADDKTIEFMESAERVKARVLLPKVNNMIGDDFDRLYATFDNGDRSMRIKVTAGDENGVVDPFAYLTGISNEALSYVPNRMAAGFAAGMTPKAMEVLPALAKPLPLTLRFGVESMLSALDGNGGTFAIVASPGGNAETIRNMSLQNWLLKAVVPVGEGGESVSELINKFGKGALPDGVSIDSFVDEGQLYITDYYDDAVEVEESWPIDCDADALLTVIIPYKGEVMKALRIKNGYDLRIEAKDSCAVGTIRLLGPNSYILPALIQDLASRSSRKNK